VTSGRVPRNRFYDGRLYAWTLDPLLRRLHQYVADHVEPTDRILDVGSGTGDLAWRLAPRAGAVVGVELSPAMVDYANGRIAERSVSNVSFVVGDASTALAPLPDAHFDLATLVLVLHEMPTEAQAPVLSEVTRVARRLLCVDFRAPMPWNVAGIRNRVLEMAAGREHYRAFREFQRRGGSRGAAERAGLSFERVRLIDARSMEARACPRRDTPGLGASRERRPTPSSACGRCRSSRCTA
jgi:SAM-dependent methyltransferase